MEKIEALQEMLPYVREFLGKTFVIKLGGEVCEKSNLDNIAKQISLIHHIGIRVVLVHGGGPQMNAISNKLGIEKKIVNGRRITDADTLEAAKMVYAGTISTDLVSALRKHGASAVGLSGADANLITAKKRPPVEIELSPGQTESVDFGLVGVIQNVNVKMLELLLSNNTIPVICSLGGDDEGNVFNINADSIASALSQALLVDKLIVLTNVPGVLQNAEDPTSVISYVDTEGLESMIRDQQINGGMLPKVATCIEAVKGGAHRTHILNGTQSGTILLELFSNQGCGTMIVSNAERIKYEHQECE